MITAIPMIALSEALPIPSCHLNININSDVTMQSSDDQIFSLHRKNLEFSTEGFPSSETPTAGQIVALSEPSTTLGLLFQFIYPQRYPSLEKLDFDSALVLAEAAEKYVVYAAIYACKFRLIEFIDSKPNELLSFAAKHNWYFLIVRLAPLLVDVPLFELSGILPSQIYTSWTIYRENWLSAMHNAAKEGGNLAP
ncbi:hypothetical protein BT96DRAFT_384492 [Gymnopus androsaceus JB14]|uniref:BTB domain-containing protein n=1 Tax=Gymnopus androsaceus JB14 TaxID=1447944 RepID=A0A6A4IJJ3_9AGAR|nr:hypothetical protein BT96DRAFT_384492 [Gymnopus androsaceus JB14]